MGAQDWSGDWTGGREPHRKGFGFHLRETGARGFLKCPPRFLNATAALLEPDASKGLSGRC